MQSTLQELLQTTALTPRLINLLQMVWKSVVSSVGKAGTQGAERIYTKHAIKQIQQHLIGLTCQNKNHLHHGKSGPSQSATQIISLIIPILTHLAKCSPSSQENIALTFQTHILSHTSCFVSYNIFYIIVDSVPEMASFISFETLADVNSKIKKQWDGVRVLQMVRIPQSQIFSHQNIQLCSKNLDDFLNNQAKPNVKIREQGKIHKKQQHPKIPPLIIPTAKSINSSRYSGMSRENTTSNMDSKQTHQGQKLNQFSLSNSKQASHPNSAHAQHHGHKTHKKGLHDLQKLACNLGQNFITVELGCLLANKRTRQVQQFSENQQFRQRCLDKLDRIETERMNSSRFMLYGGEITKENSYVEGQQNAKKFYRKVLQVNLNIFTKKVRDIKFKIVEWITKKVELSKKKTEQSQSSSSSQAQSQIVMHFLQQIFDMSLVGIVNLSFDGRQKSELSNNFNAKCNYAMQPSLHHNSQNEPESQACYYSHSAQSDPLSQIFSLLLQNLLPVSSIIRQLIQKVSLESQKLHINMLLNRNKGDASTHYGFQMREAVFEDQFLSFPKHKSQKHDKQGIQVKVNEWSKVEGSWKQHKKIVSLKKYSDPILFYLGGWLQSLQQMADMSHPMFYYYQSNVLKAIAFYLWSAQSKVSNYYCAQYLFPFFIMLKRQILQLSHPFICYPNPCSSSLSSSVSSGSYFSPLSHRHPQLIQYFLQIISYLLESSNKHLQRLISNVFIRNIYFMETVQNYLENVIKTQNISAIIDGLRFYRRVCDVYVNSSSNNRRKEAKEGRQNREGATNPASYLFQNLADYLCPRNGCIAYVLNKYQNFISPSNLDQYAPELLSYSQSGGLSGHSTQTIQTYLHEIFLFISYIFGIASPSNTDTLPLLEQDICSYFIKYSIMNFIKLYSLLTVNELANIGGRARSRAMGLIAKQTAGSGGNRSNGGTARGNETDGLATLSGKDQMGKSKINAKEVFMIDFLKILTNISINRTPQIGKKFREYRVLQFFVREIELEFSVKQNIQKYIKKAVNIRDVSEVLSKNKQKIRNAQKQSNQQQVNAKKQKGDNIKKNNLVKKQSQPTKKMTVPDLNLTGQFFKKNLSAQQPKTKQMNSTMNQQKQKKMVVPALNITLKTEQSFEKNKKQFLDDMIEQIVTKNSCHMAPNAKKKSFKEELNLKLDNLNINNNQKSNLPHSKSPKSSDSSMIYFTERKIRKIYSNKFLHSESLLLILSLILYKNQLDPIYCDQMPIIHGKLNVLYILHYHLNHEKNKFIIPMLAQNVSKIKPYLSGQRLFKLLANQYTDLSYYKDWTKINAGAFGVIMSAKTGFSQPQLVAIKQMNFPKSIYERCVLNDIFTQITSLEMFRLQERVTKMYNYGVIDNTYVIIMKKYHCSLRDWRLGNTECQQAKLFPVTLPNILALFYEVIKGLKLLHEQNVTHYDIKSDNILLEFISSSDPREPPKVKVVFADFGVAKIYDNQKEQLDLKSRGTQCIKSPEMLTLALKNKKQADNYDRRKKIGTTKASDIWSLGCLLYEIITGEFLFNSNDWVHFFMQVTSQNEQIVNTYNCQKMKNNIYLIDFIKYILIRDPQHRPSIQNIICRFENLYSLLVANPQRVASSNLRQITSRSLEQLVRQYYSFIRKQSKQFYAPLDSASYGHFINKRLKSEPEFGKTRKVIFSGKIVKIMEDIYFCERQSQVVEYETLMRKQGITHIVVEINKQSSSRINKNRFKVLEIISNKENQNNWQPSTNMSQVYRVSPRISDLLREVLLMKGKLLFVNSQSNFCVNLLIFTLSYWFKCTAYETWCLINTQVLQFPTLSSSIVSMSQAVNLLSNIQKQMVDMPKLQCICGSVTIILKKKFQQKRGQLKICKCKKSKNQNSGCFSKNCPAYLELIQKRYNIVWDHLTWTLVTKSQLLTPLFDLSPQQLIHTQIMLNSAHPLGNMTTDPKAVDGWKIYQCKTCQMWILATNQADQYSEKERQIWLILNNLIKSCRQGIMIPNAQQDFKARTPALNYYTLSKLHMTQ